MSSLAAIARKELRTYFLAPVALIFITTFLLASLFAFFWVEGFFSRNVAGRGGLPSIASASALM